MDGNYTNFQANLLTTINASSPRLPRNLAIFDVTFLSICSLAGTFGNARVCVLLRRQQDLRKVQHYLLANLALTGVLSSLLHAPFLIVLTIVNYFQIRDLSVVEIICRVGYPSGFAFIVMNSPTLWLMAFDRQDCVLHPFRRRLTKTNVKKIIPVIWMLALFTYLYIVVAMRYETTVCVKIYPYNDPPKYNRVLIALMLPISQLDNITVLIITVTFLRIMKKLRSPPVNSSLNSPSQRYEKALTVLTYKICGVFLLCRVRNNARFVVTKTGGFQATPATFLITITLPHLT